MKRRNVSILFFAIAFTGGLASCERDFFIKVEQNQPQLIVEAYINNEMPLYNYVVLSRSINFYDPGFQNIPVGDAIVTVTEGVRLNDGSYDWDRSTTRTLKEGEIPQVRTDLPGFYFDPKAVTDPSNALMGIPGKHYLLEIETEGKRYSATTVLPIPVKLDSITSGNHFIDSIYTKARITLYYKDPDTVGNTFLYYWRNNFDHRDNFGWGGMGSNRYVPGTDDLTNGQYMTLTPNNGFPLQDTVQYHLISVERKVYNFWDSFNKARDNGGPFATPVKLLSTVQGEGVIGCFSGFSLSTQTIITK